MYVHFAVFKNVSMFYDVERKLLSISFILINENHINIIPNYDSSRYTKISR